MPAISGIVKDASGTPCAALVRVLRRSDMSLVGQMFSDPSTGAYSVTTADTSPHVVERYVAPVGDLNAAYRKLGVHMAGANNSTAFTDTAGHTVTTNNDAKVDAVTTDPYGGSSGIGTFDGASSYLSVADAADLEFGSSDLTIRFKMKSSATTLYCCPLGRDNGTFGGGAWAFMFNPGAANGVLTFWNASYSGGAAMLSASSGDVHDGNWYDIELCRSGSDWYLFLDGTLVATVTWAGSIADAALDINIGRLQGYSRDYNGKLKDVEILIGKAIHTANFTPPTATFTDYLIGTPTENAQIFDNVIPV